MVTNNTKHQQDPQEDARVKEQMFSVPCLEGLKFKEKVLHGREGIRDCQIYEHVLDLNLKDTLKD